MAQICWQTDAAPRQVRRSQQDREGRLTKLSGAWGKAKEVPGTASLNVGGWAAVNSVSCAAADNCGVGGIYWSAASSQQVFIDSES